MLRGWTMCHDNCRMIPYEREESQMNIHYLLLCGMMWKEHASADACEELVRALHSDDPDVVRLASALLDESVAAA
jgi:hypothetical protein